MAVDGVHQPHLFSETMMPSLPSSMPPPPPLPPSMAAAAAAINGGGGSQDWVMNSAVPMGIDDSSSSSSASLSLAVASQLEKQKLEMDLFLQLENQKLRTVVQEETRQQSILLQSYETRILNLLYQKHSDLNLAKNKAMKLQQFISKAEIEVKCWQKKAMENEAMVIHLNKKLEQAINGGFFVANNGVQDAESCCDDKKSQKGKKGSSKKIEACKMCRERKMNIVFLPCRHLSSCKSCENVLGFCPICNCLKKASIEVEWV